MSSVIIKKLLLLSVFCFVLEAFRMVATETLSYIFLPWNLILAWVPLALARQASKEENRIKLFAYCIGWLIFFPNAPYIITDLIHLKPRNDFPLWFDSTLIYSFAFTGLIVGILSAVIIYNRLKEILPHVLAKTILFSAMLISGYGIYIGRFLRWYSWSIITDPIQIFNDTIIRILHPLEHPGTYGMTLMIGTLLCLVFLVFESFTQKEKA